MVSNKHLESIGKLECIPPDAEIIAGTGIAYRYYGLVQYRTCYEVLYCTDSYLIRCKLPGYLPIFVYSTTFEDYPE